MHLDPGTAAKTRNPHENISIQLEITLSFGLSNNNVFVFFCDRDLFQKKNTICDKN